MNGKERLIWVDRMRGLAILSVVIQHLTYYFLNDFMYHKLIGISNMAVFFFISGYILDKTANIKNIKEYMQFVWKKTIQLLLPFLVWGIIVNKYFFSDNWEPITINTVIKEFTDPHLWFLLTLYGYCLLFPMYQLITKHGGVKYGIVFWTLSLILIGVIWKQSGAFKLATLYMIYFATGTIFTHIKQMQTIFYHPIVSAIAFICICLLLPYWESGQTSISNIIVKIIISFSVILIIYNICTLLNWNNLWDKFTLSCGKYSLAIYAAHWGFLQMFNEKLLIAQNELIGFTISLVFGMLICKTCILLKKVIETSPIIDVILFGNYSYLKKIFHLNNK